MPHAKIGFSKAMSCGWLKIDKTAEGPRIFRKVSFFVFFLSVRLYDDHFYLECMHMSDCVELNMRQYISVRLYYKLFKKQLCYLFC